MALKHGAVGDGSLGITGCLIHELKIRTEDVSIIGIDSDGSFEDGKSLRKKVTVSASGEQLSTASLPTVGAGAGSGAAAVHINSVETTDKNEGISEFSVEGEYHSAGAGAWV